MAGGKSHRRVATVMFVDVVESTRVAAEVGDRRWRELVGAFRSVVRRQLKRFNGHEVDTAGDGFFAWFESPANALRAAAAITSDVQALGLDVRCGVHTGELEQIDGRLGGIAAHIGARVMAAGGPAQILATSTVRDLVVGGDTAFEPFGEVELKGVPGRWALHRLTAVAGQPAAKPLDPDEALDRRATPAATSRERRRLLLAGLGVAGLIALGFAAWGTGMFGAAPVPSASPSPSAIAQPSQTARDKPTATPSSKPTPTPPVAMVRIDPDSNQVVAVVPDTHTKPGLNELRVVAGNLWHQTGDFLVLRNLATGEFIKSLQLPYFSWAVDSGFGSTWVGHRVPFGLIDRLDPTSDVMTKQIDLGIRMWDMAVGDRAVYVLDSDGGEDPSAPFAKHNLHEIDPVTNLETHLISTGSDSAGPYVDFVDGLLRVKARDGYIFIDPATRKVVTQPDARTIWETERDLRTVTPYDPATGQRGQSIGTDDPPHSVVEAFGAVWVAAGSTVYRIDPVGHRVLSRIDMPEGIYAMSIAIDEPSRTMWVSNCYGEVARCNDVS